MEALRRLLDTDQGCDLRLLVQDNASSDGTPEAIREAVPEADLAVSEANLGFAAGVNRMIARSTAPWFLTLNSDAWPAPGAIGTLVAAAERHTRAAAVAPRLERPDGELEHSTHPFPSVPLALSSAVGLHRFWAHDSERQVDWAVGAALLMRRDVIDLVGGFDDSFFMYAEDLEWCHRASAAGWEIWFTSEALVVHVGNASGEKQYGAARAARVWDNTYRFYRRHHGPLSTGGYRAANALGAMRGAAKGVVRRDRGLARFWWDQVPVHLRGSR